MSISTDEIEDVKHFLDRAKTKDDSLLQLRKSMALLEALIIVEELKENREYNKIK